jgi:hypothetical protein
MPQKPDKFIPALYGGIIMGVLSAVPILNFVNCLCCAGTMLGGFMAVYFYKKQLTAEMDAMTNSDGLGLGAFAGLFGAIASTILGGLIFLIVGDIASEMVLRILNSSGVLNNMPPESRAQMEQQMAQRGFSIVSVVANFIICPLFGLLGGLIGYAVFRKKDGKNKPDNYASPVQPS